ncbi:hypothetical protein GCM10027073_23770 [Streptomyces chlorus]
MPKALADAVQALVAEYEAKESPEAVCARDADKLECVIQGIECRAQSTGLRQRPAVDRQQSWSHPHQVRPGPR